MHFDFERILQMFTLVAGAVHVIDNVMDNAMDILWTCYRVLWYNVMDNTMDILWTCYRVLWTEYYYGCRMGL